MLPKWVVLQIVKIVLKCLCCIFCSCNGKVHEKGVAGEGGRVNQEIIPLEYYNRRGSGIGWQHPVADYYILIALKWPFSSKDGQ